MSHEVMHCAPLALDLLQTACCTALQPSFPLRDLSVHRWFLNVALPPSSVRCSSLTQSSRSREGWAPLPPCVSPSPHRRCTRDATPHLRRLLWCVSRAPRRISGRAAITLVSRRALTVWVWVWVQGARRRHAHVARAGQFGSVDWLETIASLFQQPACAAHLVEYGPRGTPGGLSSPVNRSQERRSIERGNRLGFAVTSLYVPPCSNPWHAHMRTAPQ
jgi:hypothetical protein